ncbi:MAG: release factor glutamine methyltransferase, partial [Actinomycetota bacterium]|nr:release factor glutamine methyltransferase [Actinomycetota bacterium]
VPGGYFVMEHAEVQSAWIAAMLNRTGLWSEVTTHRDLNGKDRATSAVLAVPAPLADRGSQEVMKE